MKMSNIFNSKESTPPKICLKIFRGVQKLTEYRTECVSSIQIVKSRDLADHLNTGHFGP